MPHRYEVDAFTRTGSERVHTYASDALLGPGSVIRIARSNPHPELRKTALFWLGQSEDPRAIALFEEILR